MEQLPQDWERGLVVAAHPDDIEYGISAAVARWTDEGKDVRYVLASSGEAGIAGLPPAQSGPLREAEERASAGIVGVTDVEFLGHPDGRIVESLDLRRDLAGAIRRHRPEMVVTGFFGDSWAPGTRNTADHRALGRSLLDAIADADNEWIHPEIGDLERWATRWAAVFVPFGHTHAVDVSGTVDRAVSSLAEHRRYLEVLDPQTPVEQQARQVIEMTTPRLDGFGAERAVGFELYTFRG